MKTTMKGLNQLIEDIALAEKKRNKKSVTVFVCLVILAITVGCFLVLLNGGFAY